MKNILIVCADKDLRKEISKALASTLKCLYIDIDEFLDYQLLNRQDITIKDASEELHKLEHEVINRAMKFKDCVTTISHDLYIANNNFKLIDAKKVFIFLPKPYFVARFKWDSSRLDQELEMFDAISKLVMSKCDFTIEKGTKSIDDLCKEIIEKVQD